MKARRAGFFWLGVCAWLLFLGNAAAGQGIVPPEEAGRFHAMPKRIPKGATKIPFRSGAWQVTNGRSLAGRKNAQNTIELRPGGNADLALVVSRGDVELSSRRYLVLVDAKAENSDTRAVLTLTCKSKQSSTRKLAQGDWTVIDEIADTHPRFPGNPLSRLSVRLHAVAGRVTFRNPRLYHVPSYGLRLRFTVLQPSSARFNGRLYFIRRHRDTAHSDRIRHYFHSSFPQIAGPDGVPAGQASHWTDIRPYLFGRKTCTASLTVSRHGQPAGGTPVKVRLELAYCTDSDLTPATEARTEHKDDLALLTGESTDSEFELEEEQPLEPKARAFWQRELEAEAGIFSFTMPESDMPPSIFFAALKSLDGDAIDRLEKVRSSFQPAPQGDRHVLVGANISRLAGLIDPASIDTEMELLAALGLDTVSGGDACSRAFYDIRQRDYGQTRFFNREYWGRIDSHLAGYSPYDGDKLRTGLDAHYSRLARSGHISGRPSAIRNTYLLDLMDEPGDRELSAADQPAFAEFLKRMGVTPQTVGFQKWSVVRTHGYTEQQPGPQPELPDDVLALDQTVAGLRLDEQREEGRESGEDLAGLPTRIESKRLYYYTRRFAAQKTSDFFRTATESLGEHFPGVLTCVNFRAGLRRVLSPETADWFLMGRQKAVTMMWNEDWLNTFGWRNNGIQLVSYYVELMRTAGRKHDLPVGGFLILMHGFADLKSYSALAHGSRFLHYWRYGPSYANYLPYSWSHNPRHIRSVGTVCRDLARIGDVLADGNREPARVALLYAKTDPIWHRSQAENRLVFLALLHDQIPVDIVTEAEIEEDGLLSRYSHLYITDRSVRRRTLAEAAGWVGAGGHIWLSGGAATRDEFDEPCGVLTDAIGVRVSEGTAGKSLACEDGPENVPRPFIISARGAEVSQAFSDGSSAQIFGSAGKGQFCVCAMRPGVLYERPVRARHNRSRGKGVIQTGWHKTRREWITRFALDTGVERPVQVGRPGVEVALFRHAEMDVALFINYTGKYPEAPMHVRVKTTGEITAVESLRRKDLPFRRNGDWVQFTLPLHRTDAVILHRRARQKT